MTYHKCMLPWLTKIVITYTIRIYQYIYVTVRHQIHSDM
jgi:hypothetical protein